MCCVPRAVCMMLIDDENNYNNNVDDDKDDNEVGRILKLSKNANKISDQLSPHIVEGAMLWMPW